MNIVGLSADDKQSYAYFMKQKSFAAKPLKVLFAKRAGSRFSKRDRVL